MTRRRTIAAVVTVVCLAGLWIATALLGTRTVRESIESQMRSVSRNEGTSSLKVADRTARVHLNHRTRSFAVETPLRSRQALLRSMSSAQRVNAVQLVECMWSGCVARCGSCMTCPYGTTKSMKMGRLAWTSARTRSLFGIPEAEEATLALDLRSPSFGSGSAGPSRFHA